MPKESKRKVNLEINLLKGSFDIINAKNFKECSDIIEKIFEQYCTIVSFRYYHPRCVSVPKSNDWVLNILPHYNDERFKLCLRVTRNQFGYILNYIEGTDVFKSLTGNNLCPVHLQLAVALFRFGNDGSGASYHRVAEQFGLSEGGMIQKCTDRVIKALLSLEKMFISWPSQAEREQIALKMTDKLPGCVGYLDGTHIPLYEAPTYYHEAYFSRKQVYGIQLQAVCDNDLVFRSVSVGYPASAHDARVFSNSPIGLNPSKYLNETQWIAADSAYRLTKYVVTPFRDNARMGTANGRRKFNKYFSGFRVKIEHSFGILKKVFGSLRSLRVRVDGGKGHMYACHWIMGCIILYNMIRPQTDVQYELNEENEEEENNNLNNGLNADDSVRNLLYDWFNRTHN